jgi:hypothetical protein
VKRLHVECIQLRAADGENVQRLCISTEVRLFRKDKDSYTLSRVTGAKIHRNCK